MRFYELAYLISPDLEKEKIKSIQEKLEAFLQEKGAILFSIGRATKKELAYPIKKKTEAFLAWIEFFAKPSILEALEKELKSNEEILRYLLVTKKPKKEVTEPSLQKKKEKEKAKIEELDKKLEKIFESL